jgi:hypothetical protein
MADEKSTPISSLNNKPDESETVNQILSKFNSLQQENNDTIPPQNPNISRMEASFENRDLNKESYQRQSDGTQYAQHMNNEKYRMQQMQQQQQQGNMEDDDDESYEEYEIEELPLWKKIMNELRVPVLIFVCIALIMPNSNNKFILGKIPFLGNEFNELTTLGFLLKALLCAIISYVLVRFIRF